VPPSSGAGLADVFRDQIRELVRDAKVPVREVIVGNFHLRVEDAVAAFSRRRG
jgi:hypothetical protein